MTFLRKLFSHTALLPSGSFLIFRGRAFFHSVTAWQPVDGGRRLCFALFQHQAAIRYLQSGGGSGEEGLEGLESGDEAGANSVLPDVPQQPLTRDFPLLYDWSTKKIIENARFTRDQKSGRLRPILTPDQGKQLKMARNDVERAEKILAKAKATLASLEAQLNSRV